MIETIFSQIPGFTVALEVAAPQGQVQALHDISDRLDFFEVFENLSLQTPSIISTQQSTNSRLCIQEAFVEAWGRS